MTSISALRARLQSIPEDFLNAVYDGPPAVETFNHDWISLEQEIDEADQLGLLDEDTATLIASVATSIQELSRSYGCLESDIRDIKSTLDQELKQILSSQEPTISCSSSTVSPSHMNYPVSSIAWSSYAYEWLSRNIHNPYPTKRDLSQFSLSSQSNLAEASQFFKRLRSRSGWTRIVRTKFGRNRAAAVSAAKDFFSQSCFDESSTNFLARSYPSPHATSPFLADDISREFSKYHTFVLEECKKSHHSSGLDNYAKDIFNANPDEITARLISSIYPSRQQGCELPEFKTLAHKKRIGKSNASTRRTPSVSPSSARRKRARTPLRASLAPTETTNSSGMEHDSDSTDHEPSDRESKRMKPAMKSTSLSNHFSHPVPLSRLGSRSSSDLRTPVSTSTRPRRNSESAATAPWPTAPQILPFSLESGSRSTFSAPCPSNTDTVVPFEEMLHVPNLDMTAMNLFASSNDLATYLQPSSINASVALPDPSFFDFSFSGTDPFNFESPVETAIQGWDFFDNCFAQSSVPIPRLGVQPLSDLPESQLAPSIVPPVLLSKSQITPTEPGSLEGSASDSLILPYIFNSAVADFSFLSPNIAFEHGDLHTGC